MDIRVFNEKGRSIINKKGELVCINPFPSMPLKFWNDKNDVKFKKAYFNKFRNIWHHGDFAKITNKKRFYNCRSIRYHIKSWWCPTWNS